MRIFIAPATEIAYSFYSKGFLVFSDELFKDFCLNEMDLKVESFVIHTHLDIFFFQSILTNT